MPRFKYSGNTLSEYTVILGLIGLLALGGLHLLGQSISGLLTNLLGQTGPGPVRNYMATVLPSTPSQGDTSGQNNQTDIANDEGGKELLQLHTSTTGGVNVTSVDGLSIMEENAKTLKDLVHQIDADPNHDPDLLALVTKLANTGHSAANSMKGGITIYKMRLEGGEKVITLESTSINNTVKAGLTFKDQFQELASYVKANPDTLSADQIQTIQLASNDITGILDQLGNPNGTPGKDLVNPENWSAMAQKSMEVHQNSNTICGNGGDASQCVR